MFLAFAEMFGETGVPEMRPETRGGFTYTHPGRTDPDLWVSQVGQMDTRGGTSVLTEAGGQPDSVAPVETGFGAGVL